MRGCGRVLHGQHRGGQVSAGPEVSCDWWRCSHVTTVTSLIGQDCWRHHVLHGGHRDPLPAALRPEAAGPGLRQHGPLLLRPQGINYIFLVVVVGL